MVTRIINKNLINRMFGGKAIIIVGPRQVGKTTLMYNFLGDTYPDKKVLKFNCDNIIDRTQLENQNLDQLSKLIGKFDIVMIDEGQKVNSIGNTLKLLVDQYKKEKQFIVTGSSSFNLLTQTEEVLTGRKWTFNLFPFSLEEIYPNQSLKKFAEQKEDLLLYGMYPEIRILSDKTDKREALEELYSSYLFKDIFEFQNLRKPSLLINLLKALALQIGSEVSYNELSQLLQVDKNTIERYVDLLEKNFIIKRLNPYYTNRRKEISKLRKIYFVDIGVRNMAINDFRPYSNRNDIGAVWENFIFMERIKYNSYRRIRTLNWFWREYQSREVDLIEEKDGHLTGFEFKWKAKITKAPTGWAAYENSSFTTITPDDVLGFVM